MKIKLLDKNCIPKKAHSIDAGFDVKVRTEFVIPPKETERGNGGFGSTGVK